MSFLGIHILTDEQVATLKAAGHDVDADAVTSGQVAVATFLSSTDIGKTIAADIASLKDSTLSGPEKFEQVVANTLPELVKIFAGGGVVSAEAELVSFGRSLVQTVFDATVSTSMGKVIADVETLFAKK